MAGMSTPGHLCRAILSSALAVAAATAAAPASAQVPEERSTEKASDRAPGRPLEAIPDPPGLAPVSVVYVNPLFQGFETPPHVLEIPQAQGYRGKAIFYFALSLEEAGKVLDVEVIDPPLKGMAPAATSLARTWTFEPAKKEGKPVRTWASFGLDLSIDLENPVFTSFSLLPVGKDDPIPALVKEYPGETGILRFPKSPPDADGTLSIEEVDFLPTARKVPWKFEPIRLKSRVTALLEVSEKGTVDRVIPTGSTSEPFTVNWIRQQAAKWKIAPAYSRGAPQRSWMSLDVGAEYDVGRAKELAKRFLKKNLKGAPAG